MSSHTLVGRTLENIDIHDLENKLKANPFIESAKVYTEMDGLLKGRNKPAPAYTAGNEPLMTRIFMLISTGLKFRCQKTLRQGYW
jgi:hypothetical protein